MSHPSITWLILTHEYFLAEEKDTKLMSSEGLEATEEEMQEVLQDLEQDEDDAGP